MIKNASLKKSDAAPASGALRPWVIVSALGAVLLLTALIIWQVARTASAQSRPDLPVHAGMYNLRQEMQKGAAASQAGGKSAP